MSEMKEGGVDPELLAIRTAALQRALVLLAKIEQMITRAGGFMDHDDQETIRESREVLAAMGMRLDTRKLQEWVDRTNGHCK